MSLLSRIAALFGRDAAAPLDWKVWNRSLSIERKLQASLEAARPRPDLWTLADFRDADATLLPDKRRMLRAHSRYEAANNPIIDRILRIWVEDLIGPEGPWLQVSSGSAAADRLIETAWARWWKRTNQAAKMRQAARAEAVDGEAVGLRIRDLANVPRSGVSLDVVILECDRLASPDWTNANRSGYIDGVHLDPFTQKPVAYDLLKAHPGTEYLDQISEIFEAQTFPAAEVLHAFRAQRPEQHRGLPRATAALPLSGMHRKFLQAKVDKAGLQAAIAFAIKSMAPPEDAAGANDDDPWQTITLPSRQGLGIMFPDGYEPTQFKTDGDSEDVEPFNRVIGGLYAGCFAMPLGRAMGQYGSTSYAAVRGELLCYHRAQQADRMQVWEPLWLNPLFDDFLNEYVLTREFQRFLADLDSEDRQELDLSCRHWDWGKEDLVVDPSRERTAQKLALAMGLTTREAEIQAPDIDAQDARAAVQFGFVLPDGTPDVVLYRQRLAQSILGLQVAQQAGPQGETAAGSSAETVDPQAAEDPEPAE